MKRKAAPADSQDERAPRTSRIDVSSSSKTAETYEVGPETPWRTVIQELEAFSTSQKLIINPPSLSPLLSASKENSTYKDLWQTPSNVYAMSRDSQKKQWILYTYDNETHVVPHYQIRWAVKTGWRPLYDATILEAEEKHVVWVDSSPTYLVPGESLVNLEFRPRCQAQAAFPLTITGATYMHARGIGASEEKKHILCLRPRCEFHLAPAVTMQVDLRFYRILHLSATPRAGPALPQKSKVPELEELLTLLELNHDHEIRIDLSLRSKACGRGEEASIVTYLRGQQEAARHVLYRGHCLLAVAGGDTEVSVGTIAKLVRQGALIVSELSSGWLAAMEKYLKDAPPSLKFQLYGDVKRDELWHQQIQAVWRQREDWSCSKGQDKEVRFLIVLSSRSENGVIVLHHNRTFTLLDEGEHCRCHDIQDGRKGDDLMQNMELNDYVPLHGNELQLLQAVVRTGQLRAIL